MGAGVLLVDECPIVRRGVCAVLDDEEDLTVVGEASDVEAGLNLADDLEPDLIVVSDLDAEDAAGGSGLCRELKKSLKPYRVLIYTARNSHQNTYSCYLAGADGFVHKGEEPHRLVDAIRQVLSGKRVWLLGGVPTGLQPDPPFASEKPRLTAKEQEILALMLERLTNRQISAALCVSLDTVKTHVRHVYRKLGVSSRKELFAGNGEPSGGKPSPGGRRRGPRTADLEA